MFKTAVFLVALSVSEHWVCATPLTKSEEFDISGNELIRNPDQIPTTYQILKNDADAVYAVWVSGIAGQPIAALVVFKTLAVCSGRQLSLQTAASTPRTP